MDMETIILIPWAIGIVFMLALDIIRWLGGKP